MLAFSERDNIYRVKRLNEQFSIDKNVLNMRWKPWTDVEVTTWIVAGAPWHVRVHRIQTARALDTAEGGFALGLESLGGAAKRGVVNQTANSALAANELGASGIRRLHGPGQAELVYPQSNTNLMNPRTVIPTVKNSLEPGIHWLVSAVFAEPGEDTFEQGWESGPTATVTGSQLVITLPGTPEHAFTISLE
ncbi:hypothetical protein D3C78_1182550 [compost metagenome]